MERPSTPSSQSSPPTTAEPAHKKPSTLSRPGEEQVGSVWDMLIIRSIFALVCVAAGLSFSPVRLDASAGGGHRLSIRGGGDSV